MNGGGAEVAENHLQDDQRSCKAAGNIPMATQAGYGQQQPAAEACQSPITRQLHGPAAACRWGSLTSTQAPAKNTNAFSSMKSCKSDHVSCRQLKYCSEATGGASSRRHGIRGRSATRAGRKWARGRRHCFTQNLVAVAPPCIAAPQTSERPAGAKQAPALAAHPRQSSLSTACSAPR